jgi:hypothetical protein
VLPVTEDLYPPMFQSVGEPLLSSQPNHDVGGIQVPQYDEISPSLGTVMEQLSGPINMEFVRGVLGLSPNDNRKLAQFVMDCEQEASTLITQQEAPYLYSDGSVDDISNPGGGFPCSQCHKVCKSPGGLKNHQRTHTPVV